MKTALIAAIVAAGCIATFTFTYWWTRFCIRMYRRGNR